MAVLEAAHLHQEVGPSAVAVEAAGAWAAAA